MHLHLCTLFYKMPHTLRRKGVASLIHPNPVVWGWSLSAFNIENSIVFTLHTHVWYWFDSPGYARSQVQPFLLTWGRLLPRDTFELQLSEASEEPRRCWTQLDTFESKGLGLITRTLAGLGTRRTRTPSAATTQSAVDPRDLAHTTSELALNNKKISICKKAYICNSARN